ncbi:hypothetical protein LCGC14_2944790 [marine sediment metagenome]|uniref:Pentapeptide repeat protein n=1 Tax=marine sediment metagenome TaxID=412755 RepID=A0A0F8ZPQ0_9ZZZZ
MKTYTVQELKAIIEEHGKWLSGDGGTRAYLSGADLSGAYLSGAYLSGADLSGADLSGAFGAEKAIEARTVKVSMRQLKDWGACDGENSGMTWVKENIKGKVTIAKLYAAGRDDYVEWLYPRVLTLLYKDVKAPDCVPMEVE